MAKIKNLSEDETKFLEILLQATTRMAGRLRETHAIMDRIHEENKTCPHCQEVAEVWHRLEPEFEMLAILIEALLENGTKAYLASRLLELIDGEE